MFEAEIDKISERIAKLRGDGNRIVVSVAGPPAAGKSTLAELLVDHLNQLEAGAAALVPMDGYHLENELLDQRGLRSRKGAPETFDAIGFVELICRIASGNGDIKYPTFDRGLDRPVPDAGLVSAKTEIVVAEGNYLLLADLPWSNLKRHFDLTVFIRPKLRTLQDRLIQRWRDHGFDVVAAEDKALGNDIPNARYVLENSVTADLEFEGI